MEPELAIPAEASESTIQELTHTIIETTVVQSEVPIVSDPIEHHVTKPSSNNPQSILEARCKRFGIPFKPVSVTNQDVLVF